MTGWWDMDETRAAVERLHGRTQLELARPSIRSVVDRQVYSWVHFHDAKSLLAEYVAANLPDASLLHVTMASGDEALSLVMG